MFLCCLYDGRRGSLRFSVRMLPQQRQRITSSNVRDTAESVLSVRCVLGQGSFARLCAKITNVSRTSHAVLRLSACVYKYQYYNWARASACLPHSNAFVSARVRDLCLQREREPANVVRCFGHMLISRAHRGAMCAVATRCNDASLPSLR